MNRYTQETSGYLDTHTGLVWKSHPEEGLFTFEEALQLEDKEWRLPAIHELFGIVDTRICDPATELPNHTSSYFWSSSPFANGSDYAWDVTFYGGGALIDERNLGRNVRLVRR